MVNWCSRYCLNTNQVQQHTQNTLLLRIGVTNFFGKPKGSLKTRPCKKEFLSEYVVRRPPAVLDNTCVDCTMVEGLLT